MRYHVDIPHLSAQGIELETVGAFAPARLLVHGQIAPKAPGRGQYYLLRNDGTQTIGTIKINNFDSVPTLLIDGQTIRFVPPLTWYQYGWLGFPLILIFLGGAIGGGLGGATFYLNVMIFRSALTTTAKYLMTGLLSTVSIITFCILAALINPLLHHH